MASRHLSRSIVLQSLYEWDFYGQKSGGLKPIVERNIKDFGPGLEELDFIWQLIDGIVKHMPEIDNVIEASERELINSCVNLISCSICWCAVLICRTIKTMKAFLLRRRYA